MTAPAREQSTAVALRDASVGQLPAEIQSALELRKLQNQVAGQLASMNWGQKLDLSTRRAVADWGMRHGVDVATEINVLGNNVYLNSAFYLRKLGELIASGVVEYAVADHIEDDKRLAKLGPEGEGEYSRRLRERIKHGVPDAAASAVVFRVKLRSMEQEITGCKWCGGGTRKNDPVGDERPVETSESRAARRAMRLLVSHVPQIAREFETIHEAAEHLGQEIVAPARAEFKASQARIAALPVGRSHVPVMNAPLSDPDDPYSDPIQPDAEPVVAEPETEQQNETQAELLDEPDPREFVIGFGDHAGKRLGAIDIADVRNLYKFCERKNIQPAFRAAALKLLEQSAA